MRVARARFERVSQSAGIPRDLLFATVGIDQDGRRLYLMMHHSARTPSRQPIFLPSA
jgi:hypothetical protein